MTADEMIRKTRHRLDELRASLESAAAGGGANRDAVRDEIVELGREIERGLEELGRMREGLQPLVERYREIFPPAAARPPAGRIDHLGSSTHRERGWSALASGDYEGAATELRRAVELDPEEPAGLVLLAWANIERSELAEARDLIDSALARSPDSSLARTVRGLLRLAEGRCAEAIEDFSSVTAAGTDRTATLYAHLYLGTAHSRLSRHREAQESFRRALELGPNLTEAHWELGCSHHADGRGDLALEAWRAGGENRFNRWGERCREAVVRLEAEHRSV
ncbi:MAG: tetratricopeptide repeat protein [Gemmatimonadota bacterium]